MLVEAGRRTRRQASAYLWAEKASGTSNDQDP